MNSNDYRIALVFPIEELKNRVLNLLSVKEISSTEDSATCHYIGDERQEEFVDVHLRLSSWRVCSSLSGWDSTTDFDATDTVTINLTLGTPMDASRSSMLGEAVRDWICGEVASLALQVMTDDEALQSSVDEMKETSRQRVLMMLCASDMLRKVG